MGDPAVSGNTLLGAKRPRKTTAGSASTDSSSRKRAAAGPGEPTKRSKKQEAKVSEQASLEDDSLSDDDDLSDIDKEKR